MFMLNYKELCQRCLDLCHDELYFSITHTFAIDGMSVKTTLKFLNN